jgi:hypothetical protein
MDEANGLSAANSKAGRLQRACLEILNEHERDGALPTSGRFIWYELEQRGIVDKTKARGHPGVTGRGIDQDVTEALTRLRETGIIPWDWIVDETRSLYLYGAATTVQAGVLDQLASVRLNPWDSTPVPLLLTESRSLAGVLRDLADDYCTAIAATNGQAGGFLHTEIAPLVEDGRPVGYLGDLDLAGGLIEANTHRVLASYAGEVPWERLALTEAQADAYNLRRLAITKRDNRYRDSAPHLAIETEALSQRVIVDIVRAWLDTLLPEPLADVQVREARERATIRAKLEG